MNNRFIIMVLDGFGAGEAPDADKYGDCGSATLQHIYEQTYLELPNMKKLGIFNIDGINLENKEENVIGCYGKAQEKAAGKNSPVGHWEMSGYVNKVAFATYPNGFPEEMIEEFKQKLLSIPDESLIYHSIRNGISTWLMAHREITLAKHLKRYRFEDFPTPAEMRQFILRVFEAAELKKIKGRIINYNPKLVDSNRYITRLGKGSFGGKGRGMAFLSNFIENVDFKKLIPKLKIEIPKTAIIGVDEFDNFIDNNGLSRIIYSDESYEEVKAIYDSYYKNESGLHSGSLISKTQGQAPLLPGSDA